MKCLSGLRGRGGLLPAFVRGILIGSTYLASILETFWDENGWPQLGPPAPRTETTSTVLSFTPPTPLGRRFNTSFC